MENVHWRGADFERQRCLVLVEWFANRLREMMHCDYSLHTSALERQCNTRLRFFQQADGAVGGAYGKGTDIVVWLVLLWLVSGFRVSNVPTTEPSVQLNGRLFEDIQSADSSRLDIQAERRVWNCLPTACPQTAEFFIQPFQTVAEDNVSVWSAGTKELRESSLKCALEILLLDNLLN